MCVCVCVCRKGMKWKYLDGEDKMTKLTDMIEFRSLLASAPEEKKASECE